MALSSAESPGLILGALSLRQVKAFRPSEGQEPSAKLADGGFYYGDLDTQRRPHGRGIAVLGDGLSRYGGEWREGHYHGQGSMVAATFDYEGAWDTDEMHGFGTIFYKDTVVSILMRGVQMLSPFEATHKPLEYRGDFHKTYHRHGKGTMTYRNGDVYDGEWNSNRRSGIGCMRYTSGERYQGGWLNDERHGSGTLHYANGAVYRGPFVHDERHGDNCIFTLTSGDEYVGTFTRDEITGEGVMRYKNGDVYEGLWKDGVRHGKGKFELKKRGATIEGVFSKGLVNGTATVTFPGKSKFIGEFEKGEKVFGTAFYESDGSCYQGEWRGDHMHGAGLMWFGCGDFYYGKFGDSKREGFGNLSYAEGSEYSGEFATDKRQGKGICQQLDGSILAGRWSCDQFVSGYQGEWDGLHFNGVGTLQLGFCTQEQASEQMDAVTSGSTTVGATRSNSPCAVPTSVTTTFTFQGQYFGILRDGLPNGKGILKVHISRCNQLALRQKQATLLSMQGYAPSEVQSMLAVGKKSKAPATPVQPLEGPLASTSAIGMYLYGSWKNDKLNGLGYIRYPNGDEYIGTFVDNLRETTAITLSKGDCCIRSLAGHFYKGGMRKDAQDGPGIMLMRDEQRPVFEPLTADESARELAWEVEKCRAEAAAKERKRSGSGGFLDALNPLNLFRSRSDSLGSLPAVADRSGVRKRVQRFEDDFAVVGNWVFAERDEMLVKYLLGVDPAASYSLRTGASEKDSNFSGGKLPAVATPSAFACGGLCGVSTFFFNSEGTVFQGEFCENRQLLFASHSEAFGHDEVFHMLPPPTTLKAVSVRSPAEYPAFQPRPPIPSGSSPKQCPHCSKEFGIFRKVFKCDGCRNGCCSSCLTEVNPITYDKSGGLAAVVAFRYFASEGRLTGKSVLHSKSVVSICRHCVDAIANVKTYGTFWSPYSGDKQLADRSSWIVYKGALTSYRPDGQGEQWQGAQCYYRGGYLLGRREGYGQQIFANGEDYIGEWHADQRNGYGRYRCSDGSVLFGYWKDNMLAELSYHGEMTSNGKRNGKGQSFDSDGSRYNGEWLDDQRNGSGILQMASGDIYSGAFKDDHFHGAGKLVHASSVFAGNFEMDEKHGDGVERFGDRVITGRWVKGKLNGPVRIFDASKEDILEAYFENGEERTDVFLPPTMVSDDHASNCQSCHAEFGFFLRKHHCRLCGHVVCDNCSPQRRQMPTHFGFAAAQRVCTGCSKALDDGQSLGIRRYVSGALYCGLWSKGVWCGSGMYMRPDGKFYVLNSYPDGAVSALGTPRPSQTAEDFVVGGPSGEETERTPVWTEECHRHLPKDFRCPLATEEDLARFEQWWTTVCTVCSLADFPLSFIKASSIPLPKWNPSVTLSLFSLKDEEDDKAALRRQNFVPQAIPVCPDAPVNQADGKAIRNSWGTPYCDEENHLNEITEERVVQFMPFPPPSAEVQEDPYVAQSFDEVTPVDLHRTLRCFSKKKMNAETPIRPQFGVDKRIEWNQWSCYPVPEYKGALGSNHEPFLKTIPMIPVPDCGKRSIALTPLDGPSLFCVVTSRSGQVEVNQIPQ